MNQTENPEFAPQVRLLKQLRHASTDAAERVRLDAELARLIEEHYRAQREKPQFP
jgi:hypothetical protein